MSIVFQIFGFKLSLSFEGEWIQDMPLIGIQADVHDPRCAYCPYKKALICSAVILASCS
jgi:hypothetical protein